MTIRYRTSYRTTKRNYFIEWIVFAILGLGVIAWIGIYQMFIHSILI